MSILCRQVDRGLLVLVDVARDLDVDVADVVAANTRQLYTFTITTEAVFKNLLLKSDVSLSCSCDMTVC